MEIWAGLWRHAKSLPAAFLRLIEGREARFGETHEDRVTTVYMRADKYVSNDSTAAKQLCFKNVVPFILGGFLLDICFFNQFCFDAKMHDPFLYGLTYFVLILRCLEVFCLVLTDKAKCFHISKNNLNYFDVIDMTCFSLTSKTWPIFWMIQLSYVWMTFIIWPCFRFLLLRMTFWLLSTSRWK